MRYFASKTSNTSDQKHITNLVQKNERVAFFGEESVQRIQNVLIRAGFTLENSLKIIDKHPDVLRLKPKQLEERLEMWHVAQFSAPQYYELFVQCPELLDFDDESYLESRYAQLRSIVATPKNIWRLLMSSPNVLVDDMKSIQAKIDYIVEEMEADITDLVKSGSLGLNLNTIMSRHVLLMRLGIYKKRNWRASEMDPNKNLRLYRIMDVSDEEFAKKTCGISMKELEAFNELYERELEEKKREKADYEEEDEESDDGSDSDDEHFDPRESKDYYDDRYSYLVTISIQY